MEDWCGNAVNTVPQVAALANAAPNLYLRRLGRNANLDLMDAHRTGGSRFIPVVILLDEFFREVAGGDCDREVRRGTRGIGGFTTPA